MRILMTTDALGGIWTYACELARGLLTHGIRTTLAVMGGAVSPGKRARAGAVRGLELHEGHFRLEWMEDPWEDVARAGDWLLRLERRVRPDIVHLNGYAHAALPWRAPVLAAGHSCVLSWWTAVRGTEPPARFDRYHREVSRGLAAADAVAVPTLAHLRAMEREYGRLPHARVVPNGRHPAGHPAGAKRPYILSVGRIWDPAKNIAALERTAEDLPWPVYVGGALRRPGESERPTNGRPSARDVPDPRSAGAEGPGFHPLGELAPGDLARWYAHAGLFVLPGRYEPFGLAPLEAGLAGCALILGDLPTLREVWGDAALFVFPDDDSALRRAVNELIEDASRRREMAARARRRALRFGPDVMAERYVALYRSLLQRSPAAGTDPRWAGAPRRAGGVRAEREAGAR